MHPCSRDRGRSGPCLRHQHGSFGRFSCVPTPAADAGSLGAAVASRSPTLQIIMLAPVQGFHCHHIRLLFGARGRLPAGAWLSGLTRARRAARCGVRIPAPSQGSQKTFAIPTMMVRPSRGEWRVRVASSSGGVVGGGSWRHTNPATQSPSRHPPQGYPPTHM